MANNCGICVKQITQKQQKLSCSDCKHDFHGTCLKMSRADIDCITADGLVWRCEPCSCNRRKSMRLEAASSEGSLTLEDIMKVVTEIRENQHRSEKDFNKSYELLNEKLEDNSKVIREQAEKIDGYLKKLEEMDTKNKELKKMVENLENRVEDLEQYSRVNTVEIQGIPQDDTEDVIGVVKGVGNALNMKIEDCMIDACHRLKSRPGSNDPPTIIVKFVRRGTKEELLRKRREKKTLSTKHMNLHMDRPIYINESLSPARRHLAALARVAKREHHYQYIWIRNGKIFLRKENGAKVIQVTSKDDLKSL